MGVFILHVWPPHEGPLSNLTWDGKLGATALRAADLAFSQPHGAVLLSQLLQFVACSSAFAAHTRLS